MKVDPAIADRFLAQAATEQLLADLQSEGCKVSRDVKFGPVQADIVAEGPNGELTVFEVKVPGPAQVSSWTRKASVLQREVRASGGRFKLVLVRRPRETTIEIDGLENLIRDELTENIHQDLGVLSNRTVVDDVSGLEISSLLIHRENTEIEGQAVISVTLNGDDDEAFAQEYFPLQFTAILDRSNHMTRFECEIGLSSWYGEANVPKTGTTERAEDANPSFHRPDF